MRATIVLVLTALFATTGLASAAELELASELPATPEVQQDFIICYNLGLGFATCYNLYLTCIRTLPFPLTLMCIYA